MPTSEHYRGLAKACRWNAGITDDPDERDTLLRIGALYDDLANRRAQREDSTQHVTQQQQQPQPDDDQKE